MENDKKMLPPGSAPIYTHSLEYIEEYKNNLRLDSDYKTLHINEIMSVYSDYDRENCLDEIQKILEEQPIEYLQSLHEKVVGDR